ncbi:hypothetical protein HDU76_010961, partial [Blyttiomyces sp. JEL0837]
HYSILKTVEKNWGLSGLGKGDASANGFNVVSGPTSTSSTYTSTTATTSTSSTVTSTTSTTSSISSATPTSSSSTLSSSITSTSTSTSSTNISTTATRTTSTTVTSTSTTSTALPTATVQVSSYSYTNGVLSGTITVKNLAYTKTVSVYYQDGNGVWSTSNYFSASYVGPVAGTSSAFEYWSFSKSFTLAPKAFYIMYIVNGQTYYDSNGGANYLIQ